MLLSKEKLTLIFVLIGCLIIFLFSPELVKNKQIENNDGEIKQVKNENIDLFKNIWSFNDQDTNKEIGIINSIIPNPTEENNNTQKTESPNPQNPIINIMSIESVLSGIENLSSDLKLEFENIQEEQANCPTCAKIEKPSEIPITPDSTCATIMAAAGACNCGSLGCTPPTGTWCVHPCCCVCCAACCR